MHAIAIATLSVRLSVTLVTHALTVQYIKICCAPHDRLIDVSWFLGPNFAVKSSGVLPERRSQIEALTSLAK